MDIRIGIRDSGREISFESTQSASEVESAVSAVLEGNSKVLKLSDSKGCLYIVPTEAIGYVELGAEEARRVGFIA